MYVCQCNFVCTYMCSFSMYDAWLASLSSEVLQKSEVSSFYLSEFSTYM